MPFRPNCHTCFLRDGYTWRCDHDIASLFIRLTLHKVRYSWHHSNIYHRTAIHNGEKGLLFLVYIIQTLKTLPYCGGLILEIVELWCLCCMMLRYGSINSQEYKSFEIDAVTINIYIYDWISPLNKPSQLWFILTQQSIWSGGGGGMSMVNPVTCLFSL